MSVPGIMFLSFSLMLTASCVEANIKLTTSSKTPRTSESFTLTCYTNGTEHVSWMKDGEFKSACLIQSHGCYPPTSFRYTFTSDVDSKSFDLTITDVSMDSCGTYSCIDISGNRDSFELNVILFDSDRPLETTEPGQDSSGTISVTTDCIFPNDVTIQWIQVQNGIDIGVIQNYTRSVENCSVTCAGSPAGKIRTSFHHNETKWTSITVAYKVVIKHRYVEEPITWTSQQIYNIEVEMQETTDVNSPSGSRNNIGLIVGSIGAVLIIIIVAAIILKLKLRNKDEDNNHATREHPENERYEELASWSRRNNAVYTDLGWAMDAHSRKKESEVVPTESENVQEQTRYENLNLNRTHTIQI